MRYRIAPVEAYPNNTYIEDHPLEKFFWDITFNFDSVASYIPYGNTERRGSQTVELLQERHKKMVNWFNLEL